MLSRQELEARLVAARAAERAARTKAAQLRRELSRASRRHDTQYRCALGGVLVALAARGAPDDVRVVECVRAYLVENPPHQSNADVLSGTPFDPSSHA